MAGFASTGTPGVRGLAGSCGAMELRISMAQISQADDPKLVRMQLLMDEAGRAASFHELDPFGERHGSWQRTIHAWTASDGLDRYVIAAVTSLDDGDEVAVMAGAEERSAGDSTGRPRFRR